MCVYSNVCVCVCARSRVCVANQRVRACVGMQEAEREKGQAGRPVLKDT